MSSIVLSLKIIKHITTWKQKKVNALSFPKLHTSSYDTHANRCTQTDTHTHTHLLWAVIWSTLQSPVDVICEGLPPVSLSDLSGIRRLATPGLGRGFNFKHLLLSLSLSPPLPRSRTHSWKMIYIFWQLSAGARCWSGGSYIPFLGSCFGDPLLPWIEMYKSNPCLDIFLQSLYFARNNEKKKKKLSSRWCLTQLSNTPKVNV